MDFLGHLRNISKRGEVTRTQIRDTYNQCFVTRKIESKLNEYKT